MSQATQSGAMDLDQAAAALDAKFNPPPAEETQETTEEVVPANETTEESEEPETSPVSDEAQIESDDDESEDETIEPEEPEDDAERLELEPEEFATLLGLEGDDISVDDDGAVKVKVKIDGEESTVSLNDLRKSYQLEGHVTKKSMALAEEMKAFEQEADSARQNYATALNQAGALVQTLEQEMLSTFNNLDWQGLEQTDPGRYAAERQKYGERYQQVEQIKAKVNSDLAQLKQQVVEKQEAEMAQLKQAEAQEFFAKVGWDTPEKRESNGAVLHDYLTDFGFSPEEVAQAADHRLLVLAEKARKFDELSKGKKIAEKRVKKAPKITKPGAKPNKRDQERVSRENAKKKFLQQGTTDALAKLLEDRM